MANYRIVLRCIGLSDREVLEAPEDILGGFSHRPWHENVSCRWDGEHLWLAAENDYDHTGEALLDEFWDEVTANVNWEGPIRFEIVTVSIIGNDLNGTT